jgi:hypothetical protein
MPDKWQGPSDAMHRAHGRGVLLCEDGTRIEGQMVNGAMHGHGVITTLEGIRKEGEYVDSQFHGRWIETRPDGARWEEHWQHGTKVSENLLSHQCSSSEQHQIWRGAAAGETRMHVTQTVMVPKTVQEQRQVMQTVKVPKQLATGSDASAGDAKMVTKQVTETKRVPSQITKTVQVPKQVTTTVMVPEQVTETVMEGGQV